MAFEIVQSELGRLMGRGPWGDDVDSFVQELAAMLPSLFQELPSAQVKATTGNGAPAPLQLEDFTDTPTIPFAAINRGNGDNFNLAINPETGAITSDAPNQPPAQVQVKSASSMPGFVVSGSGDSYLCTVYPNGTGNPGIDVLVTQLFIDSSETIPSGTPAIVTKNGGQYTMQVPVFI